MIVKNDILPRTIPRGWPAAALVVLASAYVAFMVRFMINVPRSDDLLALSPFIEKWHDAQGAERLTALFEQYYSHRIVFTRLVALSVYIVCGELNLVVLQALGVVFWLALVGFLARNAIKRGRTAYLVPLGFLLLQPLGFTNVSVAMQAVQNPAVLSLAALASLLAVRSAWSAFTGALAVGVGAVFTSANGLLVLPLLTAACVSRKNWSQTAVCAATMLIACGFYFRGFESSSSPFSFSEFVLNALVMLGGPFSFGRLSLSAVAAIGATIALAALVALWQRRDAILQDELNVFVLFLLGSVAMAAYGRIGWGAEYMLQDRYSPYGLLLTAATGILWQTNRPWPASAFWFATAFACVVAVTSYARIYPSALTGDRWARAVAVNHQLGEPFVFQTWGEFADLQKHATDKRIIQLPANPSRVPTSTFVRELKANGSAPAGEFIARRSEAVGATLLEPEPTTGTLCSTPYAALLVDGRTILLPALAERRTYFSMLSQGSLVGSRVAFILPTEKFSAAQAVLVGLEPMPGDAWRVAWKATVRRDPSATPDA